MKRKKKIEELEEKLREIIPNEECNYHLRDYHWIPEIIELFKSFARSLIPPEKDKISSPFSNRNLSFVDGWNYCRKAMLEKINEIHYQNKGERR